MGIFLSQSGSGNGALTVRDSHVFASNAARDSYFVTNPTEKVKSLYVVSNNTLQQWDGSVWLDMTAVIRGPSGVQGVSGNDGVDGVSVINAVQSGNDLVFNLSNASTSTISNFFITMKGADGLDGSDGQGVPIGGTTGQILSKIDGTNFNTQWIDKTNSIIVREEGSLIGNLQTLNFIGTAVTVTNGGSGVADITISASGGGAVDSVNGKTGVVTLTPDDLDDSGSNNKFISNTELTKLFGIEVGATADLTASEIETLYESNLNTNKFTDAEKTKLANLSNNFKGLFANSSTRDAALVSPTSGNYVIQTDTDTVWFYDGSSWINTGVSSAGDMLQVVYDPSAKASNVYDVDNHETGSVNSVYSLIEKTKLAGIEVGATGDLTGSEIKALYEAEANTNAFDDSYKAKLDGIASGATSNSSDAYLLNRLNHIGDLDLGTF